MNELDLIRHELIANGTTFPIYMDYQSTTPVDPVVLEAMLPYFSVKFGNPHSRSHIFGWETEQAIETARTQVALAINADPGEIIFTSGATESNNLAIKGLASYFGAQKKHIITTQTEHKCVMNTCHALERNGFKITYLPVQSNGLVDTELLASSITDDTLLVSIMFVHNEIGVIQPMSEIGCICREHGVFLHSDIAQAFGKIPINVKDLGINLASISSHKTYGPKGVGALYVSKKPRIRIKPIFDGGGQERGMRSGTLPTALIVGFGVAADIAMQEMHANNEHITFLSRKLLDGVMANIPDVFLNGDRKSRYWGNLNLSFSCIEGESMILAIKDLAVSSGSACTSATLEPSYVLKAIGIDDALSHTSIRFGIGKFTKEAEIEYAIKLIKNKAEKLREISPLWKP